MKCEIHTTDIRSLRILLKFIAVTPVSAFKELSAAGSVLHDHTHSQLEMEKVEGVFFEWRSALLLLFAPARSCHVSEPCMFSGEEGGPWLTVCEGLTHTQSLTGWQVPARGGSAFSWLIVLTIRTERYVLDPASSPGQHVGWPCLQALWTSMLAP